MAAFLEKNGGQLQAKFEPYKVVPDESRREKLPYRMYSRALAYQLDYLYEIETYANSSARRNSTRKLQISPTKQLMSEPDV